MADPTGEEGAMRPTAGGHAALADYWCERMSRQEFGLLMIAAGCSDGPTATRAWDEARNRARAGR